MSTPIYTFFITTLGCKVNQYESQAFSESWQALGWQEIITPAQADIILINSCAVTASAVADVRTTVRRMHKQNQPAQIWITGCSAQTQVEQLKELPGVHAIIPTALKNDLLKNPALWLASKQPAQEMPTPVGKRSYPLFEISNYQRARPVLKVQDGCSHCCTYCIVPLARGSTVSREPKEVLAEARRLLDAGFREIIFSGINLSQFRAQTQGDFWDLMDMLIHELENWEDKARFRISSLEPGRLDERALDILSKSRLICPQLHISLQSGSYSVLKRMGRGHYHPQSLVDFCTELSKIWPIFGLGADILSGFPGETEAEFKETVNLVEQLPFTYAHVFPFSARSGTKAALMPEQVEKKLASERSALIRALVQTKKDHFLTQLLERSQPLKIVLESLKSGLGVSEYYVECKLESVPARVKPKELLAVKIIRREEDRLIVALV